MISLVKPASETPDPLLESVLAGLVPEERKFVRAAYEYAAPVYEGKVLGTGEGTMDHALALGENLAALRLDAATRAAGLLFALPEYLENGEAGIAERFDPVVANLVAGVWKLNRLRVVTRGLVHQDKANKASQAEVLRKMLLGMVEDIRVVLIRLASRTQTLRFLARSDSALRAMIGRETLDIYAPLANRLGVWQLKWELEDLSFRLTEPETYKSVARMLDERRPERESFIADAIAALNGELRAAGIQADVSGRPKHLYSIYNKMRAKGLDFDELYDVRGVRVLVEHVRDCYTVLGIAHNLWQPIPGEFDDYISRPKGNNYRSLHTAVIGTDGRALEVQIRTHEMHRHAELGVAAHWRYKEGGSPAAKRGDSFDDKIAWLRQVLAWRDEVVDSAEWVEQAKRAALDDTVYVFTPQGRVIDLPAGSTPVDFAYALHTDLGHRCRGAKVDGVMVPLDYKLKNGQSVEIVTAKSGGPSRDWLDYLKSSRARNKVRQFFNAEEMAHTIAEGRAMVEKEMQREGATKTSLEQLAQTLGFDKTEDFFAAVGRQEVGPRALQTALRGNAEPEPAGDEVVTHKSKAESDSGILIVGVDRLLTQLARCCKPVPPDPIVGFVTRGRGISVHRHSCKSLAHLLTKQPERAIEAQWGAAREDKRAVYPVDILVQAADRQGLLRDISEVLSKERINVTAVNTLSKKSIASMAFTTEVGDLAHLARAIQQIEDVKGVVSVRRR
jgi:GTP pyrophosphokinase